MYQKLILLGCFPNSYPHRASSSNSFLSFKVSSRHFKRFNMQSYSTREVGCASSHSSNRPVRAKILCCSKAICLTDFYCIKAFRKLQHVLLNTSRNFSIGDY